MTPTRFVCEALSLDVPEPPAPKRGQRYGTCDTCWLCAGPTGGRGWPLALAIPPTFTQFNCAAVQDSDAVCGYCSALTRAETFQAMVKARGLAIKTWTQCGWHSYSHFVAPGLYEAPGPTRWREILAAPPALPCVIGINTTGMKHTLFRSGVTTSAERLVVQIDEEKVYLDRREFLACLEAFEALTALGCGKEDVETGRYHPESLRRAGLAPWRRAEDAFAPWRSRAPQVVALAAYVGRSWKWFQERGEAPVPAAKAAPLPAVPERKDLFS